MILSIAVWMCLLEKDSQQLSALLTASTDLNATEQLLRMTVDACPGEFVARSDWNVLCEEGSTVDGFALRTI